MSEIEDLDAPAPARALPRSSAGLILDDADRAFLYRVLAIHAGAGIAPSASLTAIEAALSESAPTDPTPPPALRRRILGARAMADGLSAEGETLAEAFAGAGFRLGPLERACLRVPSATAADLPVAAALFAGLAALFEGDRRR